MSSSVYPTLPGLAWNVKRTTLMPKVQVRTTPSDREYRARDALLPRYQYTLSYEFLRGGSLTEWQTLNGFFELMGGDFDSFLFTDPDDNAVVSQTFGTGDGSTVAFQLVRALGGFVIPVADVSGSPLIFKDGVVQSTPANYSIGATGLVTFTAAPSVGQALTWTGSFYRRCRFLRGQLELNKFMQDYWEAKKVELLSLKAGSS